MDIKQRQATLLRKLFATTIKSVTDNRDAKVMCVVFASGDKEIVRCSPQDDYDPEIGFALAYLRHILGSKTQVRRFLKEHSRVIQTTDPSSTDCRRDTNPPGRSKSAVEYGWFRNYMEEHKLTLAEVCELTGLTGSTVSRIRCGYRVSAGTLDKLCSSLGLTKEEVGLLLTSLTKHQPRYDR